MSELDNVASIISKQDNIRVLGQQNIVKHK